MFAVGIFLLFLGMSLLAPQGSRGAGTKNEDDDETESVPLMADGYVFGFCLFFDLWLTCTNQHINF
jgi:hypothetical protein